MQILDGETGYLVSSPEQCAERIIEILDDPTAASAMARRGKLLAQRSFGQALLQNSVTSYRRICLMHRLPIWSHLCKRHTRWCKRL